MGLVSRLGVIFVLFLSACGVGTADYVLPPGSGAGGGSVSGGGAGGGGGRLQVSTFQAVSSGLPSGFVPHGAALLDNTVYLGGDGIFTLDMSATQWVAASAPLNAGEVATSVTRDGTMVLVTVADAAGNHGGVLAYDFGPGTWRRTQAPDAPAYALLKKGTQLLLAAGDSLWASSDGDTWMKRSAGACVQGAVKFLVGSPAAQRIFSVAQSGLCYSDDQGMTWSTGLLGGDIIALAAADQYVLAVSTTDGAQRSDNYGATFHPFDPGATVSALSMTSGEAFAVFAGGVRTSNDGGQTWSDGNDGLPSGTIDSFLIAGNEVLASMSGQLWLAQLQLAQ